MGTSASDPSSLRGSYSLFLEPLLFPLTFVQAEPTGVPGLFHGPRVPPPLLPAWPKGARAVCRPRVVSATERGPMADHRVLSPALPGPPLPPEPRPP